MTSLNKTDIFQEQINKWIASETIPQPLLLHGDSADALAKAALTMQQQLFCETEGKLEPCEQCRSCKQIKEGSYPNILSTFQENNRIKIKEIRQIKSWLNLSAWTGPRIVIITEADRLELAAANMLLKTLEEPKQLTRFLLTTTRWRRVLPTIRSRCVMLRMPVMHTLQENGQPSWLTQTTTERIGYSQSKEPLTESDFTAIYEFLETKLREYGPTPEIKQAFGRLRDYHYVVTHKGNERMVRDLLIGSLPS